MNEPQLFQKLLEDNYFGNAALDVMTADDVSNFIIGRLSSITLQALICNPEEASPQCGFIYSLLSHCENPSVIYFFETITSDPMLVTVQQWLTDMGFVEYILREIYSFDPKYKSNEENQYYDKVWLRALTLYNLIHTCSINPNLQDSFRIDQVADALKMELVNAPEFVKTARWKAISSIVCEKVATNMLELIHPAFNILLENFEHLAHYRVCALIFVTKMMKVAPLTTELLMETMVPQLIIHIITQFPNSSLLHRSFFRFINEGLNCDRFATIVVNIYTPILMEIASERTNRVLAPMCFEIIKLFIVKSEKSRDIKVALQETADFNHFVKGPYTWFYQVLGNKYGGENSGTLVGAFKQAFLK